MTRGLAARLLAGTTGFLSIMTAISCECSATRAEKIFYASLVLYAAATIDDIVRAPLEVRKHNQRLELGVAPMIGNGSAGVVLGGRF